MKTEELVIRQDVSFHPAVLLHAGNLTAMYESGRIRYVKTKEEEIVRMIYPALRDENWNTIPPSITGEDIQDNGDSFIIFYEAEYNAGPIHYKAQYAITGTSSGSIIFRMQGESLSDFRSRRLGMCVHHPIPSGAGKAVEILNHENKTLQYRFPTRISPHQPFTDIKAMSLISAQHSVTLEFEGDSFETEDQRNWTDDSFKTYSGPLDLVPMLQVGIGDRVEQTIRLILATASMPMPAQIPAAKIETKIPFPLIGYQRGHDQPVLSAENIQLFQSVPFSYYRVDIHMGNRSWKQVLAAAAEEAIQLQTSLELVIFFHVLSASAIDKVIDEVKNISQLVESILILAEGSDVPSKAFFLLAHDRFRAALPGIKLGYGTDSNFAELNRNLPGDLPCDFVSFPVHPQTHFTDSRSILENLGSQHSTIDTLRYSIGDMAIHVSPITLQQRVPFGGTAAGNDPRQHTGFAAWWMLNAISNFSEAGHLTFFELVGERGIISHATSRLEKPSPVFQALQKIKVFSPAFVVRTTDGAVCFENSAGDRLLYHADFSPASMA